MKCTTPAALIVQWRELAEVLKAEGCPEIAAARERCATELEACLHTIDSQPLSVEQAASESGYTEEHLRRMLRDKPELNAGRTGKPLIFRRDLPRKAQKKIERSRPLMYDPVADARSLMSMTGSNLK